LIFVVIDLDLLRTNYMIIYAYSQVLYGTF